MRKHIKPICLLIMAALMLSSCDKVAVGGAKEFATLLGGRIDYETNNLRYGKAAEQYSIAIENGNIEWMHEIVDANPGMNVTLGNDATALYKACWSKRLSTGHKCRMIDELLELGADPMAGDQIGVCAFNCEIELLRAFTENERCKGLYNTDVGFYEHTDILSEALLTCRKDAYPTDRMVEMLVAAGAKPYAGLFLDDVPEDERGGYGGHFKYTRTGHSAVRQLINIFIESGGETGLKKAVECAFKGDAAGCLDEVRKNGTDAYTDSELYMMDEYIACFGTPEQSEEMSSYTGTKFAGGFLDELVYAGNLEMIRYFVEKNDIDIYAQEDSPLNYGQDAFEAAARCGRADICAYFAERDVDIEINVINALWSAVSSEDLDTVKTVYGFLNKKYGVAELDVGAAFNIYLRNDNENIRSIIDFFFEQGHDLRYVQFKDLPRETAAYMYEKGRPLHPTDLTYAVTSGDTHFVQLVLDHGADPNQQAFESFWYGDMWDLSYSPDTIVPVRTYIPDIDKPTYPVLYKDFVYFYSESNREEREKQLEGTNGSHNDRLCMSMPDQVLTFCDSGMLSYMIEHGMTFDSDILLSPSVRQASAASVKVLIDAGADVSVTAETLRNPDTGIVKKGPFKLDQVFAFYDRNDLVELV